MNEYLTILERRSAAIGPDSYYVSKNGMEALYYFIGRSVTHRLAFEHHVYELFTRYKSKWEEDTKFSSSVTDIVEHPSYLKIIRLGKKVLPYIIEDLFATNNHWFYALEAITGENPIPPQHAGDIVQMKGDWLNWAVDNNIHINVEDT